MAPYVERVLLHPQHWAIQTTALLIKSRLEVEKTRKMERSCMQLQVQVLLLLCTYRCLMHAQTIADGFQTLDTSASHRLKYAACVALPSRSEILSELGHVSTHGA